MIIFAESKVINNQAVVRDTIDTQIKAGLSMIAIV